MKTLIVSSILFTISFSVIANHGSEKSSLSQLLSFYYDVKNALINSDAATAATKSGELLKAVNSVDTNSLSEAERKAFTSLKYKLAYDARHISEVKDITHQRDHFKNLSLNMYALAKAVKLSAQAVYEEYCPMKEAYWLSNEVSIKNPYYGKEMLTCGEVKDTVK